MGVLLDAARVLTEGLILVGDERGVLSEYYFFD